MTLYYRISDPSDVRDLGTVMAGWIAAGNPKAADWAVQPDQPDPDATWVNGKWVFPGADGTAPDWAGFRAGLRTENGYAQAFRDAFTVDPVVSISLISRLDHWELSCDWSLFAESLLAILQTLPADKSVMVAGELLQLAERCRMDQAFIRAMGMHITTLAES